MIVKRNISKSIQSIGEFLRNVLHIKYYLEPKFNLKNSVYNLF